MPSSLPSGLMDDPEVRARLPRPYALALRLRDAGVDDALIAECVGVDPEALPALLEIAAAKLANLARGEQ
jgi:hypothetical protein